MSMGGSKLTAVAEAMNTAKTRGNTDTRISKEMPQVTAKMLATLAAFDYAEKALAGAAQKAGFKNEEDMQEYVKSVRRCR